MPLPTLCPLCHVAPPCRHFQPRVAILPPIQILGHKKSRKQRRKEAYIRRLEARRQKHTKQERFNTTLCQRRDEQLSHPTRAANRFYELAHKAFPRHKMMREKIRGYYILDFYFPAANLGVEIDGSYHELPDQKQYDERRTNYLTTQHGTRILRFTNQQVFEDPKLVIQRLSASLSAKPRKREDPGNPDPTKACAPADLAEFASSTAVQVS